MHIKSEIESLSFFLSKRILKDNIEAHNFLKPLQNIVWSYLQRGEANEILAVLLGGRELVNKKRANAGYFTLWAL